MCHNTEYCFWLVVRGGKCTFISNQKHFPHLQSSTTMLRKTYITTSTLRRVIACPSVSKFAREKVWVCWKRTKPGGLQHCFLGGKGSSCSFQYVQELYLEGVFGQHNTDCIHWPEKSGHCKEMAISEDCCRTSSVGKVLDCRGGRGLDSRDRTELECLKTNWEVKAQNKGGGGGYRQKCYPSCYNYLL